MANGFVVAIGICSALTGSIAVSVLATKDLPREETPAAALVEEVREAPRTPAATPRRRPTTATDPRTGHYPGPWPLERGR